MKEILDNILSESKKHIPYGKVASYIPELAKVDKNELGICLITNDGERICSGDADKPFTMQSIVKPLILLLALMDNGMECICNNVGVSFFLFTRSGFCASSGIYQVLPISFASAILPWAQ